MADYVMTIDSDTEDYPPQKPTRNSKPEAEDLNPEFIFDVSGDPYVDIPDDHIELVDSVKKGSKPVSSLGFPS